MKPVRRLRNYRQAATARQASANMARAITWSVVVVVAVITTGFYVSRANLFGDFHVRTFERRAPTFLERIADDPEFAAEVDDILADFQHSIEANIDELEGLLDP